MGFMDRGHHMRNGGQHWGDKFGAIGKRFNPRAMSCVFKKKEFFDKDGKVDQKKVTTAFVDKVNKDWKPVVQSALTACFADLEAAGKKNGHSAQNGNDFSAKQLVLCVRSKMAQNCPAAAEKKSQTVDCVKSKAELEACDPFHIPSRRGFGDMMRRFEERKNRGQGQKMMAGMSSNGMGGGEMGGGMRGGPRGGMGGEPSGGMGGGKQGGMGGQEMGGGKQGGMGGQEMGGQGMGGQGMGTQSGKASKKGPEMSAKKKGGKTGKVAKEMGDKNGKGSKKMNNKEKGNSQKAGKMNGKSEKKS
ncbi:hypothetical protein B566_EDAN015785 [Ephemera danica]|nr:hypothetical protein B566_EDAN015785 [Ephemera danica]